MAASLSLTQLSGGNPVYEKYYRQVDPSSSGRVGAGDAALFLKRSGLTDLVLGKIWDLADSDCKGLLNKQQFFVALRLVACAQNGLEVSLKSLNAAVPPPKFHDTSSPLQFGPVPTDCPWAVKAEEKLKFDAIFDSLSPVGGMLTGDKVKPVLLNSKLPVDVLGRVWELSDIDRDGMLDKDEFAVVMHLVYRALESEPVPMSLPATLIPPSKRKKLATPPVMPLLPSPAQHKERGSAHSGSKTLPAKPTPPQWVVSPADKAKYDDLFAKTDSDMDGLVSGAEVRDIFLKTGLPSATLACIWELCDIGDVGKLTQDQFALALYLINQKLSKGIDPPQTLSPEMIPPSDRLALQASQHKFSLSLSQDLQEEVQKGSEELSRLQADRQEVQEKLERLDEQKRSLEEQLGLIQQQCSQQSDPFTVDPFSKVDISGEYLLVCLTLCFQNVHSQHKTILAHKMLFCYLDPFGHDPFKGTDPFAADKFFKQPSVGFPSEDPFGSSDPFTATTGPKEPDPFTSRTSNAVTPDPFASGSSSIQDTDPFGSKMDALGDSDPFSSTGTGHDPFGGSDIPAVSAVELSSL
uniref:Epidermal growth factor receptor pathway substrate 15 n=1 Tax=Cyprinus carpio TaxID=7962 RepID=A0A8C2E8M0_CYPCA